MAPASNALLSAALDLAWSHWTGLGVRGSAQPPDSAVDPEALLYLTSWLAPYDPRLVAEVGDWWSRYRQYVSGPRLNRLGTQFDPTLKGKLAALIKQWTTRPTPSGKSRLDDLTHPARALLRLRSAFGVNARADLLLALLTQWKDRRDGVTALTLSGVGYGKRNVAVVLDDLRLAGLVVATPDANRVRYRLANANGLASLLPRMPLSSGQWHLRMPIIVGFLELANRLRDQDVMVQAIEANKHLATHTRQLATLGIKAPHVELATDYWEHLQTWLLNEVVSHHGPTTRNLLRMLIGTWIGPGQDPRTERAPSGAVLPALSADPARDDVMTCLDLVQVSTVNPPGDWAWAVLSDAATNVYQHTIGLSRGEHWRFVSSVDGVIRTYDAEYAAAGPLAPGDIIAIYGDLAAARARRDQPAVQLRLTLRTGD